MKDLIIASAVMIAAGVFTIIVTAAPFVIVALLLKALFF